MNGRLAAIAATQGGVFTRAQAYDCGYSAPDIRNHMNRNEWRRLRRGTYAEGALVDSLGPEDRHRLLVHAVLLTLGGPVAVSHVSAAVLHGLPVWGTNLGRVHVTRLDGGASRIEADVVHHVGEITEADVVRRDGVAVVDATRAVVETAATNPFEAGVVTADAALHAGATDPDRLLETLEQMRTWPGARAACSGVTFADGRSESVGESRARVLFHEQGLPAPDLQREIRDRKGRLVGRVDFLFVEQRVIAEFDGRVKYKAYGDDPGEVVFREKVREDEMRALGYGFARMTWHDLDLPGRTAARLWQVLYGGRVAGLRSYLTR